MFALKGVVRFVIEYTWISTLSHVAAFILRLRELSWRLTRWLILEDFAIWAELVSEKVFNVYEFLMRRSHAFVAKLNDKSFFWFPATMSVWEGEQHEQQFALASWIRPLLRMIIMTIAELSGRCRQSPIVLGGEGQSLGTKDALSIGPFDTHWSHVFINPVKIYIYKS